MIDFTEFGHISRHMVVCHAVQKAGAPNIVATTNLNSLHLIFTPCIVAKLLKTLPQGVKLFSLCGCCLLMHSALFGDGIELSSS